MTKEELAELQKKALEQFKIGKSLFGKDGNWLGNLTGCKYSFSI